MTGSAAHLLLVEDSDTQALQMRHMLLREGFQVTRAATAEAALDALNGPLPDLVIADFHLPGMNGDELARRIRLNSRTRTIPVLMLTEAREQGLERQGLESGADAYVPKSAGEAPLLLRLRALLRPRAEAAVPEPAGAASPPGASFRRTRLLLVDDSPTQRLALAARLGREGHEVQAAADAGAALAALSAGPAAWDGVLLNAGGGLDGPALAARLHDFRSSSHASFQIVVLLGEAAPEALAGQLFAAGADELIQGPAAPEVLSVRLRAALRRKLLLDEERRAALASREQALAMERAQAKAAMAEALARANAELEDANRQLIETQTRLVQAAKMASLGELVAGIAHEINNPLAFIQAHQGTVERLLRQAGELTAPGDEIAPLLARARDRVGSMTLGLGRIQDLVANMRKFSRLDDNAFQRVDVPEAIGTVLTLLGPKLGDRVVVERDLQGMRELVCLPALFNQVVMNLVSNAADAIPGQGHIAISSRSDWRSYVIEVRDSGPGVAADLQDRVFEPFFTTKPVGTGTGLGLAIAYNVVSAHEGSIAVGAAPEGGACFTVTVPIRTEP
ncbi:response regulator [Roseomonas haemaphysalidis]|uniref:histidine kinase n=1 Tax=Roseomonas haemaphysalidis TaxID=2768162 RepID=A0ABS3KRZ4_9PROT|nr:response regulator [Roseomonas haemaphysalidis]MBO1079368.1 response regulator [Roseomonas haemaphysalidis]